MCVGIVVDFVADEERKRGTGKHLMAKALRGADAVDLGRLDCSRAIRTESFARRIDSVWQLDRGRLGKTRPLQREEQGTPTEFRAVSSILNHRQIGTGLLNSVRRHNDTNR
jgi:hypothetical protein